LVGLTDLQSQAFKGRFQTDITGSFSLLTLNTNTQKGFDARNAIPCQQPAASFPFTLHISNFTLFSNLRLYLQQFRSTENLIDIENQKKLVVLFSHSFKEIGFEPRTDFGRRFDLRRLKLDYLLDRIR